MEVDVTLFAPLCNGRFKKKRITIPDYTCITDLLEVLDISRDDVCILIVNNRNGTFDQLLNPGDKITFISPIGGG